MIRFRHYSLTPNKPECWIFQVIKSVAESPMVQKIEGYWFAHDSDCDGACAARCQLSSRPRLCKRACGTCCARCDCVPPGTSGNYDACPCYANMTTHGGRHKCP
ncbi:Gibberellin-regulated protein 1 [Citrus sinensis]|uniref:Gibberellin-regulated protein 1 n=1 Tax=Citrus sinensis TaxID=2711 RepID=A0ACB8KXU7_CITSI|nr:Gibberellin-regulated protein 1 [Citrus sinensis]